MEPTQIPPSTPGQAPNTKIILAVLAVIVLLALGYFLSLKYSSEKGPTPPEDANKTTSMKVVVENTPAINGVTPAPAGLPKDIPLEKGSMLESATTEYPDQNAKQLSLSYQSLKTVAEKYAEYKDYMTKAGYTITEGSTSSPVRAIFGTKADANLSVVISSAEGKTLVQLAYLLK